MDAAVGFPLSTILEWIGVVTVILIALNLIWSLAIGPRWQVWASHQKGLADLAQANNEQQIQIAKAKARLDAAQLNKQAAIVEAEAVAAQIEAIGSQLTEHGLYLRWQWIKMMEDSTSDLNTIYVPTEANLPVLEAGRLNSK